ncbi:MAG: stage III sporulation protein AE [Clostridia bacterium]|nr:stage III sporulation protein AE [Clostridia bacterium]
MKKLIIIFTMLLISISKIAYATEENIIQEQKQMIGIADFIKEANKYSNEYFGDMNDVLNSAIKGEVDNSNLIKKIFNNITKEIKETIKILGSVLVVIIIHAILKSLTESLQTESVSKIAYYVQYILIITLVMSNFAEIIDLVKDTVQNLVGFMNSLLPILLTLMVATGNVVTASTIEPIILLAITFIGNLITYLILPILLVSTSLGIISKISDKVQIDKIAKYFKSGIVWILGILLTIFVGVVSIEGTLTSSVDGITAKTAKAAVSTLIPVVGKILGDSVDSVIGCASILKGAVGIVGVLVVISISMIPIIKIAILSISYYLTSAIVEPIADKKIGSLLEQIGDTFKILLAILFSISTMLIIGTTLVIKISNSGLMYR